MKEIEVKILEIDRKRLVKNLLAMGARKTFDGGMHAVYFDFSDRGLKKANNLLRLRKEGDASVLAFKEFVRSKGAKVRKETETEVSDFEAAGTVLEGLGLKPWLETRKRRVSYALDGAHFEFDKYEGKYARIPEFMEIEAKDPAAVFGCAKLLGFSKDDCKAWTTVDLMEHYSKR